MTMGLLELHDVGSGIIGSNDVEAQPPEKQRSYDSLAAENENFAAKTFGN